MGLLPDSYSQELVLDNMFIHDSTEADDVPAFSIYLKLSWHQSVRHKDTYNLKKIPSSMALYVGLNAPIVTSPLMNEGH